MPENLTVSEHISIIDNLSEITTSPIAECDSESLKSQHHERRPPFQSHWDT